MNPEKVLMTYSIEGKEVSDQIFNLFCAEPVLEDNSLTGCFIFIRTQNRGHLGVKYVCHKRTSLVFPQLATKI